MLCLERGPSQVTVAVLKRAGHVPAHSPFAASPQNPFGLTSFLSGGGVKTKLNNGEWLASEDLIIFSCIGSHETN